ncbi:MAG: lysophospholipid acyltransferase family protein [Promethearchaeota archaeon]
MSSFGNDVPHPRLELPWMHERVKIPKESLDEVKNRYSKQGKMARFAESLLSRVVRFLGMQKHPWIWYRIAMKIGHWYMKVVHRLEIRGKENIPEGPAIFYLLHNGDNDVIYFLTSFQEPVGVFTDVGNGYLADFLENVHGFVVRRGTREIMVEKMVRTILEKNAKFVIWPEGSPARDGHPKEPFSGIIRVYSTINARRDVIPFVPVLMRGSETYLHRGDRRKWKILVEFLKPVFFPRDWLKDPREGGKTTRQMINTLLLHLAKKIGYTSLKKNHALEYRRSRKGKPWRD